jgi:CRISPR-associated protein (TIGR02584 family)
MSKLSPTASSPRASRPVAVLAALGPNPAPLAELIWALARQRGLRIESLYIVVDSAGELFLQAEFLRRGAALDGLIDCLGLPFDRTQIHCRVVTGPDDSPLDDENPEHADRYNTAIWEAARAAVAHAGNRPVVFGLVAGRQRTMTAMSTMAFQLLARRQDGCVDVRVTDRRAEGGSGFFYPEQKRQTLTSPSGFPFIAADVQVRLIDVQLPRLRGLLSEAALHTYAAALSAGQAAVDAAEPPYLLVDLATGKASVSGEVLPLSPSEFIWWAILADARRKSPGRVLSNDLDTLRSVIRRCAAFPWTETVKNRTLMAYLAEEAPSGKSVKEIAADLSKLRADTRRRLTKWCVDGRSHWGRWLIPESSQGKIKGVLVHSQQIALGGDRIDVRGGGAS